MKHASLWALYTETGDRTARDTLLNEHLGLVHHVARRLAARLAADLELGELVSAGSIGLMNAIEGFDPSRGLSFSTFAAPRIRGAILDELRRQDHATRSVRRKAREIQVAREALVQQLGAAPTDRQLSERLEIEVETLWRWQSEVSGTDPLPIDRPVKDDERPEAAALSLAGATGEQIEDELSLREETDALRRAIGLLKPQEQTVLALYYFEELTQEEVAAVLGVTASRISQIRSRALAKLRTRMGALRA
jgi:RNA polymerase sigma factor for flagellar operon FliA